MDATRRPARDTSGTVRALANWANLSTPLGLAVAALGRCEVRRGPRGLHLAEGYRLGFPVAGAFTVGSVVITPGRFDELARRLPRLLEHEERHATQWCHWLGLPMLPAYLVAAAWSWLRTGDLGAANWFEVRAGLADGGYRTDGRHRAGRGHRTDGRHRAGRGYRTRSSARPSRRRADRSR